MTTETTTPLATTTETTTGHTGADRTTKLGMPTAILVVGALLSATGLILGRIPHRVPGGFHWDAYQTDSMCHLISRATGHAETSPVCVHAHEVLALAGGLIVAGMATVAAGAIAAVLRCRAAVAGEPERVMDGA